MEQFLLLVGVATIGWYSLRALCTIVVIIAALLGYEAD